jgi:hypothetical protein
MLYSRIKKKKKILNFSFRTEIFCPLNPKSVKSGPVKSRAYCICITYFMRKGKDVKLAVSLHSILN